MLWFFRRVLDRLLLRSTLQVASQLEAEIGLGINETRVALLRRAEALEEEQVPGFAEVAASLRAQALRLGADGELPGGDVLGMVAALRAENLREGERVLVLPHQAVERDGMSTPALPAPAKRRGRAKKAAEEQQPEIHPEN